MAVRKKEKHERRAQLRLFLMVFNRGLLYINSAMVYNIIVVVCLNGGNNIL